MTEGSKRRVTDLAGIAGLITAIATVLCMFWSTFVDNKDDKQDRLIESVFELTDYRLRQLENKAGIVSPEKPGEERKRVLPHTFTELKGVVAKSAKAWSAK